MIFSSNSAMAHSISYSLTAHFNIPHGLACALPLPHILRFNGNMAAGRIGIMAEALGTDKSTESMVLEIIRLFERLGVSHHLADYGIDSTISELISKSAFTPGRADNNIVEINHQELDELIQLLF